MVCQCRKRTVSLDDTDCAVEPWLRLTGGDPVSLTHYCSTRKSLKRQHRTPLSHRIRHSFVNKWLNWWLNWFSPVVTPTNWPESLVATSPASSSWVRKARLNLPAGDAVLVVPLGTSEREELVALRRKVRQLQMERDILSKDGPSLPTKASRRSPRLHAGQSKPGQTAGEATG